jgi:Xaa-Pro dipeptidase
MASDEAVLKGKYPAKAHALKVAELIKSAGGDASGTIYAESAKTRMNEASLAFEGLIATVYSCSS